MGTIGDTADIAGELHRWISAHPDPSPRQLAEGGWVAPHWPRPWGRAAEPADQIAIGALLDAAGIEIPDNPIGIGWAGPTLLAAGSEEQKSRYLTPLLAGEEFWCQLFSEPEAGSDLSSLRTRAVRDGDEWVISGQKIFTTWADRSTFGILLARTDPDVPQHRGISYFVLPMDLPGIEVRELREMTGGHHFNEVFLDGVRVRSEHLIGAEGDGWRLARVTLGNERVSLSSGGVCWGMGPTSDDFFDVVRDRGGLADPLLRQRAAEVHIEATLGSLLNQRVLADALAGTDPGPQASLKKLMADEFGQRITELAADLTGTAAMLDGGDAAGPLGAPPGEWPWAFLFARALTVGGGTTQVQRNILAERELGLPHDQIPTAARPWSRRSGKDES